MLRMLCDCKITNIDLFEEKIGFQCVTEHSKYKFMLLNRNYLFHAAPVEFLSDHFLSCLLFEKVILNFD